MEYIKSAFASIMENKGRSFLTMLGIIIGISSVITILAIGNGMKESIGGELDSMQGGSITMTLDAKKTDKFLTGAEVRAIGEQIPEAYGASLSISGVGIVRGRFECSGAFQGSNEIKMYDPQYEIVDGRFFTETDAESGTAVCVMSQADAVLLFATTQAVGKTLEATMGSHSSDITVVGLTKSTESSISEAYKTIKNQETTSYVTIHVPYTLMTQTFALAGANATSFKVYPLPDKYDEAALTAKRVTENYLGLRGEKAVSVQSYTSFVDTFARILNIVTLVVAMIAAISLLVGGIGVMNIMTVSVTERTREIGIRKALGARTGSVLAQFLAESAMITLIGGMAGMVFGYLLTFVVSKFMSFAPVIKISDVMLVVAISTSIGLFFGIYPALRAAKMNPIEALRYE